MKFSTSKDIQTKDFVLGGMKVSVGSGDRLRSPAGSGQSPPPKLLGFEYLGSFSVNNFEAFSPKSFKYILGSECKLKGDVT
jgi:hypothetical protein